MSKEVTVPAVGESISSGVLSIWHKKDGDSVEEGDLLFTLETDKVSSEITADDSGVLHTQVEEGDEVKIGQVVATIEAGEAGSAPEPEAEKTKAKAEQKPADDKPAESEKKPEASSKPPKKKKRGGPTQGPGVLPPAVPIQESSKGAEAPKSAKASSDDSGRTTRKKLTPLRRKIAAQLVNAQQTSAILTTFNECDMSAVMKLRKQMQEDFMKKHDVKLGFMSFFIKAAVHALQEVPQINARMDGEELVQNHYYDMGVAVGTDRGLIVPVIRDCDQKSFADIENALVEYAQRAREGKITLDDLQGGVFTISNGGVYGSLLSTPILNPPQSGILGLHKIQERPMAVDGQVVIRPMMYLALSYDHRVVDGKEAVTFLVKVKECIENPMRMLLGA